MTAYCPTCGSDSLTTIVVSSITDKRINWGRAVVGDILFGQVGGAVGALTGKNASTTINISANQCLKYGTTWNPTELYEYLKLYKGS